MIEVVRETDADYFSDSRHGPCLSQSIAHILLTGCPHDAYMRHPMLGGETYSPTKSQEEGTVLHALLSGDESCVGRIPGAKDRRLEDTKSQEDEHRANGRIPVLDKDYDRLQVAAQSVRTLIRQHKMTFGAMWETSIYWDSSGVQCKGRLDNVLETGASITCYELKSTGASLSAFARNVVRYGYDIQAHAYTEGLDAQCATKSIKLLWLVCERKPPHNAMIGRPSPSVLEYGRVRWERARDVWQECLTTGQWPSYGVVDIELPGWVRDKGQNE